jgi:hypothetical protein
LTDYGQSTWRNIIVFFLLRATSTLTSATYSLTSMLMLLHYLNLSLPTNLYPLLHPIKAVYAFHSSTTRTSCPTHLNPIDLISLKIFCE